MSITDYDQMSSDVWQNQLKRLMDMHVKALYANSELALMYKTLNQSGVSDFYNRQAQQHLTYLKAYAGELAELQQPQTEPETIASVEAWLERGQSA